MPPCRVLRNDFVGFAMGIDSGIPRRCSYNKTFLLVNGSGEIDKDAPIASLVRMSTTHCIWIS